MRLLEARESTRLLFDDKGRLRELGLYSRDQNNLYVSLYKISWEENDVRLENYESKLWIDFDTGWVRNSLYTLNRDGLMRERNGEFVENSLEESILEIARNLPLVHYIEGKQLESSGS